MSKAQHYHLVATEVAFLEPENQQIGALKINVLLRSQEKNVPSAMLAKAQQLAQLQFFDKLQDNRLEVKDVFIFNISYLGFMTEEKFLEKPEGMTVRERPQAEVPITELPRSASKTVFD